MYDHDDANNVQHIEWKWQTVNKSYFSAIVAACVLLRILHSHCLDIDDSGLQICIIPKNIGVSWVSPENIDIVVSKIQGAIETFIWSHSTPAV